MGRIANFLRQKARWLDRRKQKPELLLIHGKPHFLGPSKEQPKFNRRKKPHRYTKKR